MQNKPTVSMFQYRSLFFLTSIKYTQILHINCIPLENIILVLMKTRTTCRASVVMSLDDIQNQNDLLSSFVILSV